MLNDPHTDPVPSVVTEQSELTLESVIEQVKQWRSHKQSPSEPIPEAIWQELSLLEKKKIPAYRLRGATGIGTKQWYRRFPKKPGTEKPLKTPARSAHLRQVLPAGSMKEVGNTLTVEFCRADGRVMKIHTTTAHFDKLVTAFFSGD